jgi:hypothetical protein
MLIAGYTRVEVSDTFWSAESQVSQVALQPYVIHPIFYYLWAVVLQLVHTYM